MTPLVPPYARMQQGSTMVNRLEMAFLTFLINNRMQDKGVASQGLNKIDALIGFLHF